MHTYMCVCVCVWVLRSAVILQIHWSVKLDLNTQSQDYKAQRVGFRSIQAVNWWLIDIFTWKFRRSHKQMLSVCLPAWLFWIGRFGYSRGTKETCNAFFEKLCWILKKCKSRRVKPNCSESLIVASVSLWNLCKFNNCNEPCLPYLYWKYFNKS